MRFKRISIHDFRNISSADADVDAKDIVLTGENGQGKTNFLEAIYTLSYGSSFRTPHIREAVRNGSNGFHISAEFENSYGEIERITTSFSDNKRKITIDGKEIIDRRDLIYHFPCIAFIHDDIGFVKGEPEVRRKFFDQMMSLHSPAFFDSMRSYRAVLMQRNAAIRNNQISLMHLYDQRLAMHGLSIMKERASAVYDFNTIFPGLFRKISGSNIDIEIKYQPSWGDFPSEEEIISYLERTEERDIKLQTTTSGIHRDKFSVMTQSGPFASIGSTGQIRLCSILFRISEAKYFTEKTGKEPILLIDDVLLELDDSKRAELLSELKGYSQAFFTFLPRESYFGEKRESIVYSAVNGSFINGHRS